MAKAKKYTNTGAYSREFTPPSLERARQYAVKDIPASLWIRVQAKAKGNISIRALILGLLKRWVEGDIEHPPGADASGISPALAEELALIDAGDDDSG